jgi:hypothetical protein
MSVNSGVFRQKVNNDSSSSGLFSGSLIVRLLILRMCKKENERLSNHRERPAGRPLTEVWKYVTSYHTRSVFSEWMAGLEYVMRHRGEYCLKLHSLNKNLISSFRDWGVMTSVTP